MNTPPVTSHSSQWPLPLRVGFRFVFSYLALYLLDPTAQTLLHACWAHFGVGGSVRDFLATPWEAAVLWAGERILGLSMPYEWMDSVCGALLAGHLGIILSQLRSDTPEFSHLSRS